MKEKDYGNEIKVVKKDHFTHLKEVSNKYDVLTKQLNTKINEL